MSHFVNCPSYTVYLPNLTTLFPTQVVKAVEQIPPSNNPLELTEHLVESGSSDTEVSLPSCLPFDDLGIVLPPSYSVLLSTSSIRYKII